MHGTIVNIVANILELQQYNRHTVVVKQLLKQGFAAKDISIAFSWIMEQWMAGRKFATTKPRKTTPQAPFRIFSYEEKKIFTAEAFNTVTKLLSTGVIIAPHVEAILECFYNTNMGIIDNQMVQDIVAQMVFDITMTEENNFRYSLHGNESIN